MQAMGPRTGSSTKTICYTYNGEDGRFFAALRMTGIAVTIGEKYRSDLRSALNDMLADRQTRCFPLSSRGLALSLSKGPGCNVQESLLFHSHEIRLSCRGLALSLRSLSLSKGRRVTQADEGSTAAWDHPRLICTTRNLRGSTSASCAERKGDSSTPFRVTH